MQITLPPQLGIALAIAAIIAAIIITGIALYCQSEYFDKTLDAIFGTKAGRFTLGIIILLFAIIGPIQWEGNISEFSLGLIVLSALFVASVFVKGRYIMFAAGLYGFSIAVYNFYHKTPLIETAEFVLIFLWGSLGLMILAVIVHRVDPIKSEFSSEEIEREAERY